MNKINLFRLNKSKIFVIFAIFSLVLGNFSIFLVNDTSAQSVGKVTICHATGNINNPYGPKINVSANALGGHDQHANDIIVSDDDNTYECPTVAQYPVCGDTNLDDGEECDAGPNGSDTCTSQCLAIVAIVDPTYCGDGIVQSPNDAGTGGSSNDGNEDCDNGVANIDDQPPVYEAGGAGDRNYCSTSCVNYFVAGEYCGDGEKNGPEECDGTAGCTESCTLEVVDDPTTATVIAQKIVCDDESYLPDWATSQGTPTIDENTAADFLSTDDNAEHCQLEDWTFEWAPKGNANPGDNNETAGEPWTSFSGSTQIEVSEDTDYVWVREVPSSDYIPFTGNSDSDPASAEMYCNVDSYHYDNYERVDDITAGETYYCIGFNVAVEVDGIRVCKIDSDENPLSGWEMTIYGENLVINGGFEEPVLSDGTWEVYPDDSLTAWAVESGDGLEIQNNAAGAPHSGNQLGELDSDSSSAISQIINTTPSKKYDLGFWYSPRPTSNNYPSSAGDNTIRVEVPTLLDETIGQTATGGSETEWSYNQYNFVAAESTTKIKFTDLGENDTFGGYLDNIKVRSTYSDFTGDDGCVVFTDVPYDTYQVWETMQDGWTQVEPDESEYYNVEYSEENNTPTVTFVNMTTDEPTPICGDGEVNQESEQCDDGNTENGDGCSAQCTTESEPETYDVHGFKWDDLNGNGLFDCESVSVVSAAATGFQVAQTPQDCEPLLSGWTINLYEGTSTSPLMSMDTSTSTDHLGWYWFENLPEGEYKICEELQDGWEQTYPGEDGCHMISLPSSQEQVLTDNYVYRAPEYNFGNMQSPEEESYCGDGIVQSPNDVGIGGPQNDGNEECDGTDGVGENQSCNDQCVLTEDESAPTGGGGGIILGGSGFNNPSTPSTPPQEILGEKIEAEPTNDELESAGPEPQVLGFKELPNTGANSNIFYVSLFLGLMSLLYASFVQMRNAEEK